MCRLIIHAAAQYRSHRQGVVTDDDHQVRAMAIGLKTLGRQAAADRVLLQQVVSRLLPVVSQLPRPSVLVPIPSATDGTPLQNYILASALWAWCDDVTIATPLTRGRGEPSQCVRHRQGLPPRPWQDHAVVCATNPLHDGLTLILIDNVITSGHTAMAAAQALGASVAHVLVWADARDTISAGHVPGMVTGHCPSWSCAAPH